VAGAFLITGLLLLSYDRMVHLRQEKTMKSAVNTTRLVSSLFPETVRDRLLEDAQAADEHNDKFGDKMGSKAYKTRPIADFFPETTIMFADLAGFTAWSSTREPYQVFELLEMIYGAFDGIARKRRVFKVETVGDCYVAVCGLPTPRKEHAVVMARFASDCQLRSRLIFRKLEVQLGPDTADLTFRIGLHSGAVTGGVLRGENARYQLFGDSMNTASRMESTGVRERIQVSVQTADLLIGAGKSHWLELREDMVHAKGKGLLKTYWLHLDRSEDRSTCGSRSISSSSMSGGSESGCESDLNAGVHSVTGPQDNLQDDTPSKLTSKDKRLIEWNADVLLQRVKAVVQVRNTGKSEDSTFVTLESEVESQMKTYVHGIVSLNRYCRGRSFLLLLTTVFKGDDVQKQRLS
jgi:class 3 adenylate cyclase